MNKMPHPSRGYATAEEIERLTDSALLSPERDQILRRIVDRAKWAKKNPDDGRRGFNQ